MEYFRQHIEALQKDYDRGLITAREFFAEVAALAAMCWQKLAPAGE